MPYPFESFSFVYCRSQGPVEIDSLKNHVSIACEKTEDRLMQRWYPRIINVFSDDVKFKAINKDKLDSFYACVTTLISNQVRFTNMF